MQPYHVPVGPTLEGHVWTPCPCAHSHPRRPRVARPCGQGPALSLASLSRRACLGRADHDVLTGDMQVDEQRITAALPGEPALAAPRSLKGTESAPPSRLPHNLFGQCPFEDGGALRVPCGRLTDDFRASAVHRPRPPRPRPAHPPTSSSSSFILKKATTAARSSQARRAPTASMSAASTFAS